MIFVKDEIVVVKGSHTTNFAVVNWYRDGRVGVTYLESNLSLTDGMNVLSVECLEKTGIMKKITIEE